MVDDVRSFSHAKNQDQNSDETRLSDMIDVRDLSGWDIDFFSTDDQVALEAMGITKAADLLDFDQEGFWKQHG